MKIAVSGSSGWLARSLYFAIRELKTKGFDLEVDFFSRKSKTITLLDGSKITTKANFLDSRNQYDLYIPLAFLTREKYFLLGEKKYEEANMEIISTDIEFCKKNPNIKALLVSSGVVENPSLAQQKNPSYTFYAKMKKIQEELLRQSISIENFNICYLYSCTSKDIFSLDYAISAIVSSASKNREIIINNSKPVVRRYVDLRQLFQAMLLSIYNSSSFEISSGGYLVEIEDLANNIVSTLGSTSKIHRYQNTFDIEDIYCSNNESMVKLFKKFNLESLSIETQILNVFEGISKS